MWRNIGLGREVEMSDTHTYTNVDSNIFNCVKNKSKEEHGTTYDPPNGNSGTSKTHVNWIGDIVLKFDLNVKA
jgi:hypothetical protein